MYRSYFFFFFSFDFVKFVENENERERNLKATRRKVDRAKEKEI